MQPKFLLSLENGFAFCFRISYNAPKGGVDMTRVAGKDWGIGQESLKAIACLTMFLDHIGAVFMPGYYTYYILRILGRIAFPIYCFLLSEGVHYTQNAGKYALRLGVGAVVSEVPFDLAFYGGLTLAHQNVMLTLLLGFAALEAWKHRPDWLRLPIVTAFAIAAEWLHTDYGAWGVVLIVAFGVLREQPRWKLVPTLAVILLAMDSARVSFLGGIPIEIFGLLALIPIFLYSGEKRGQGRGVKFLFYCFYPAHLLLLWALEQGN